MAEESPLESYWDGNLDPLNQGSIPAERIAVEWRVAYDTFLSPETSYALKLLGPLEGKRLLEIGTGLGYGAVHFAERGADVIGIDVSQARCRAAEDIIAKQSVASSISIKQGNAEALPVEDASVDLIFCRDVVMYADHQRVAQECSRVLRDGGRVVFIESLEGNPVMKRFRKASDDADYLLFTRHITYRDLQAFAKPLRLERSKAFFLLSLSAFYALFEWRSHRLYRTLLGLCYPVDAALMALLPPLRPLAWRGVALYQKSCGDG